MCLDLQSSNLWDLVTGHILQVQGHQLALDLGHQLALDLGHHLEVDLGHQLALDLGHRLEVDLEVGQALVQGIKHILQIW